MNEHLLMQTYKDIEKIRQNLRSEIINKYSWSELLNYGFKAEAIIKYRQVFNCVSILEAKQKIEEFLVTESANSDSLK